MRVLFITSSRIGDAVLSTGILNHLIRTYPEAKFTIACGSLPANLFVVMPQLERIIIFDKLPYKKHWLALWLTCYQTSWDLIVDLRGSIISHFLRSNKDIIIPGGRKNMHKTVYLAKAMRLSYVPRPVVWIDSKSHNYAESLLRKEKRYVAFGPTANWKGKMWPVQYFADLARRLKQKIDKVEFVILYGQSKQEHTLVEPLLQALPDAVDCRGTMELVQIAAVLQRSSLFVGNDSGLMHLAAAVGVPTLGLFGPSRVKEYAPIGQQAIALHVENYRKRQDMANLSVQTVADKAIMWLL